MYDYSLGRAFPVPDAIKDKVNEIQSGWQPPNSV